MYDSEYGIKSGLCVPWCCVICKNDELVLRRPVFDKMDALLYVGHHDPVAEGLDADHHVGNVLQTHGHF